MNVDVSVVALKAIGRGEHTDVLDATDFGDVLQETKQAGSPVTFDSFGTMGRP